MRIYDVMSASLRVLVFFTCVHTLAYTEFSPSRTNLYPYQGEPSTPSRPCKNQLKQNQTGYINCIKTVKRKNKTNTLLNKMDQECFAFHRTSRQHGW